MTYADLTPLFQRLLRRLAASQAIPESLKPTAAAMWALESGWGESELAKTHLNFGGLKWRDEMQDFASHAIYTAWDGPEPYCRFVSLDAFIAGWWAFLQRSPYASAHGIIAPDEWLNLIGPIYCPNTPDGKPYAQKVRDLRDTTLPLIWHEARRLHVLSIDLPPADELDEDEETHAAAQRYDVRFLWGRYRERQHRANALSAVAYVEQHFNSAGLTATGSEVVVARNAGAKSRAWGHGLRAVDRARIRHSDAPPVEGWAADRRLSRSRQREPHPPPTCRPFCSSRCSAPTRWRRAGFAGSTTATPAWRAFSWKPSGDSSRSVASLPSPSATRPTGRAISAPPSAGEATKPSTPKPSCSAPRRC